MDPSPGPGERDRVHPPRLACSPPPLRAGTGQGWWAIPARFPGFPGPGPARRAVGLFGGTFNPPHRGHLSAALLALRRLRLDRVIFIPSAVPPHKPARGLADFRHRLHMVRLTLGRGRRLEASALEARRPGVSYTVDTVRHMRRRFRGRELFFVIGADTVPEIRTWRRYRSLLGMVRFAVIARPGHPLRPLRGFEDRFVALRTRGVNLSSRRLRGLLARGRMPRGALRPAVARYIRVHSLYGVR